MTSLIIVGDYISKIHEESIFAELEKKGYKTKRVIHSRLVIISKLFNRLQITKLYLEKVKIFINEYRVNKCIKDSVPDFFFL